MLGDRAEEAGEEGWQTGQAKASWRGHSLAENGSRVLQGRGEGSVSRDRALPMGAGRGCMCNQGPEGSSPRSSIAPANFKQKQLHLMPGIARQALGARA